MKKLWGILILFLLFSSCIFAERMTDGVTNFTVLPGGASDSSDGTTEFLVVNTPSSAMTDGNSNLFVGFQPQNLSSVNPVIVSGGGALYNPIEVVKSIELVPSPEATGVSVLVLVMILLGILILIELFFLFYLKRKNKPAKPTLRLR